MVSPTLRLAALGAAGAAALHLALRWRRRGRGGKRVLIGVSKGWNDDDLRAAEAALSPHSYHATLLDTEAMPSQPIGLEQAANAVLEKISQLRKTAAEKSEKDEFYDLAVACETCIARAYQGGGTEERWIEIFVVVVRDLQTGGEALSTTTGIEIQKELVAEWLEAGCEGVVGHSLARDSTGGAYTRRGLLTDAIRVAASNALLQGAEVAS